MEYDVTRKASAWNSLKLRAKHDLRLSPLARPYWEARRLKIARRGSFAQHGEDKVLLELVGDSGTYLDIGASHPFLLSNTYLLYQAGWRGVTVEPIRGLWEMHRRWRPDDVSINAGVGLGESFDFCEIYPDVLSTGSRETADSIVKKGHGILIAEYPVPIVRGDAIMRDHFADRELTLLSIDVEGAEHDVLRSFDFSVARPRYVLFENRDFFGDTSSAALATRLLEEEGYRFVREIGCNSLYEYRAA
jgi:FkbM family methyltransferase